MWTHKLSVVGWFYDDSAIEHKYISNETHHVQVAKKICKI